MATAETDLQKQLSQLLGREVVWFQRAYDGLNYPKEWTIRLMSINGVLLLGLNGIAIFVVYQYLRGESKLLPSLFLLGLLAALIGGSVRHMIHDMRELRLIYGYTNQEIFFVENIQERNFFMLPFTDIHKISLVRYTNGRLATVFFHPLVPVSYRTINQERGEERPMPTFEHFPDDEALFDQLKATWQQARIQGRK